jgi:hypothetical protein
MSKKMTHSQPYIAGEGIETSHGVVLLTGEMKCRVCGATDVFEWPNQSEKEEDLDGVEVFSLITAVARSKNWIVQKVMNFNEGNQEIFIMCPTCLELFLSATTGPGLKKAK